MAVKLPVHAVPSNAAMLSLASQRPKSRGRPVSQAAKQMGASRRWHSDSTRIGIPTDGAAAGRLRRRA